MKYIHLIYHPKNVESDEHKCKQAIQRGNIISTTPKRQKCKHSAIRKRFARVTKWAGLPGWALWAADNRAQ